MTTVDWELLALICTGGLIGLIRGAVRGVLDLLSLTLGFAVALLAIPWLTDLLGGLWLERRILLLVACTVIVGVVASVGGLVLRLLASPLGLIRAIPPFGWLDRLLGILPGLIKGAMFSTIVVLAVLLQWPSSDLGQQVRSSDIGDALAGTGSWVFREAGTRTERDLHALTRRDIEPAQTWVGSSSLPTGTLQVDTTAERDALDAINTSRADAGLPEIDLDEDLTDIARDHARGSAGSSNRRVGPGMPDVGNRLSSEPRPALAVGAVMASGSSVEAMIGALMGSEPHREVILSNTYIAAGFGVLAAPNGDAILVGVFVL